jgi:hypothetical protein
VKRPEHRPLCHVERSETISGFLRVEKWPVRNNPRFFASLRMTSATLDFFRSDDQMDHTIRRGDEEAVEIVPQLLDFVAARDAVNF